MEPQFENDNSLNVEGADEAQLPEEQETSSSPEQEGEQPSVDPEVEELRKKNAQLYARLKKLEAAKETPVAPPQPKKAVKSTDDGLPSREEIILFAKGLTEEDVADAKFISARKGISLTEATNSMEYNALKTARDSEKKNLDAALRASRGSQPKPRVTLDTPGLSDEEHKRLWKESFK